MNIATPTGALGSKISFKMNRPWGASTSLEALELQQHMSGSMRSSQGNYLQNSASILEKKYSGQSNVSIIVGGVEQVVKTEVLVKAPLKNFKAE